MTPERKKHLDIYNRIYTISESIFAYRAINFISNGAKTHTDKWNDAALKFEDALWQIPNILEMSDEEACQVAFKSFI